MVNQYLTVKDIAALNRLNDPGTAKVCLAVFQASRNLAGLGVAPAAAATSSG